MQTGYYNAAWNDIKNSPGWLGKLAVLALVGLIPVFGWIVVYGYLFGWARDIAWNVHAPLPEHVFDNADGKLYSRGFFALVISFVCAIIPVAIAMTWHFVTGAGPWSGGHVPVGLLLTAGLSSMLISLLATVLSFVAAVFAWVGTMRMSVYGRLAPGLQFGKIWAMMRRDPNGLLRILGMSLLLSLALSIVMFVLMAIMFVVGLVAAAALAVGGLNFGEGFFGSSPSLFALISVATLMLVPLVVCGVLTMALSMFVEAMVARALGYWTRQFDVPAWRGQDDPMPFELASGDPGSQSPFGRP